jgi:hypothetical protein
MFNAEFENIRIYPASCQVYQIEFRVENYNLVFIEF